jgi:hypothetical protein
VLELDAGDLGEAEGHRVGAVGNAEHDVGARRRMLAGELASQLAAHAVHRLAEHAAVGPREVDQLEDAATDRPPLQPGKLGDRAVLDLEKLARLQLADHPGADEVEGAGLRRHHHPITKPADHQRVKAVGVHGDENGAAHGHQEAVGALGLLKGAADLVLGRGALGARDQVDQDLGVRRGGEDRPLVHQLAADLGGVGEVAVMGDGQRAGTVVEQQRLGIGQDRASRGGVPGVAHGDVAGEAAEDRLVEVFPDQPHPPVGPRGAGGVDRDDAGAFLPPVLEGVQAQVGEPCRLRNRRDPENTAHVSPLLPGVTAPLRDPRPRGSSGVESPRSRSCEDRRSPSAACLTVS